MGYTQKSKQIAETQSSQERTGKGCWQMWDQMVKARVSIRANGTIRFDRKALNALRGLGIEFVIFHDERLNRTTAKVAHGRRAASVARKRGSEQCSTKARRSL